MLRTDNLHLRAAGILAAAVCLLFPVRSSACTGISFVAKDGSHVMARSIEWAAERLNSRYVVVPRGHSFRSFTPEGVDGMEYTSKYGFVGVAVMTDELMVDGLNEQGLNAGLFFFPEYGSYLPFDSSKKAETLSDFQFVSWALANFSTVDEVIEGVKDIRITGLDKNIGTVHWRLGDRTGRQVVLEIVGGEMNFYENPVGVLTNSPGFQWHLTNLGNYVNLVPGSADNQSWNNGRFEVKPLSGGSGMLGLPGDPTSPSRFVRIAVYKATAPVPENGYDAALQSFKILESLVIPIGIVKDVNVNAEKSTDMISSTQFTAVSDLDNLRFYYRTMDNSRIRCIDLKSIDFKKVKYQSRALDTTPEQVELLNIK